MTLKYEAIKLYHKKKIIPCCADSFEKFVKGSRDTLDIRINNIWLYNFRPPIKDYRNYSHTFSPIIMEKLR